jgi:hypothetical protein
MDPSPTRSHRRGAALLATLCCGLGAAAGALPVAAAGTISPLAESAPPATSPLPESDYAVRPVCPPPQPGRSTCLSRQLVPLTAEARAHTHPIGVKRAQVLAAGAPAERAYGLIPQDLHSAYGLPAGPAATQTVAIVDAYNDPTAEQDLKGYSEEFGLPECTTANGCFKKVNQKGEAKPLPFPKSAAELKKAREGTPQEAEEAEEAEGWALEISLDVQTVHAVCQTCHILLVEANSPFDVDLYAAENTAAALGANEISNSWGGRELEEDAAFSHPGVVITASAGDFGYREWLGPNAKSRGFVEYPASSPHVVAVGGTRLLLDTGGAYFGETVWNDGGEKAGKREGFGAGGGGCSELFGAPSWQLQASGWPAVGCGTSRAVADVSADADPYTGLAVHDSTGIECQQGPESGSHWCTIGGTSLAAPIIAAVYALAGGAHGVAYPAQTLYEKAPAALHDITQGSNGECTKPFDAPSGKSGCTAGEEAALSCASAAICLAGSGYDGPTGVGTPNGIGAFEPGSGKSGGAEGGTGGGVIPPPTGPAAPATTATSTPPPAAGVSQATTATPQPPPLLSALRLSRGAIVALHRARRRIASVGFSFALSEAAQVTATLARGARAHGRWRYGRVASPQSFSARRGSQSRHLAGRRKLRRGRYLLTLTPARGVPVSISFQVR